MEREGVEEGEAYAEAERNTQRQTQTQSEKHIGGGQVEEGRRNEGEKHTYIHMCAYYLY